LPLSIEALLVRKKSLGKSTDFALSAHPTAMTSKPTLTPLWADVLKELYDLSPWEKLVYYQ
jgi:hypothetical protein